MSATFSVVIPTLNRAPVLKKTLEGLQNQTFPRYEVIVVDDGSTDETRVVVEEAQRNFPVSLRYFYHPRMNAGAARNLGAQHGEADFLVFLGDDTVPGADFLDQHWKTRQERRDSEPSTHLVIIGYTAWPEEFPKTRFMEYVGERGWQFGFSIIEDPENIPFNFFYTSNLSLSRRFFLENGGFDENFPECNWEDIELGLRLKRKGMRLVYAPQARTYHYHPISISSFIRRQHKVGRSAWTFYEKHPELGDFLGLPNVPQYTTRQRLKMWLITGVCSLTENFNWPDLSRFYPDLMSYHYHLGILKGGR